MTDHRPPTGAGFDLAGLHSKYTVSRVDGRDQPGGPHEDCDLFVLDLTHDPHAVVAAMVYAGSCQEVRPQLAADLLAKVAEIRERGV